MSTVYNPEAELVAQIERLELEARNVRRKLDRVTNENDRRVLNKQLQEIAEDIEVLRSRVP